MFDRQVAGTVEQAAVDGRRLRPYGRSSSMQLDECLKPALAYSGAPA